MGNLLSKPRIQLYCKNWRELETTWWQFRATYGNLSQEAIERLYAAELGLNIQTVRQLDAQRARENGLSPRRY